MSEYTDIEIETFQHLNNHVPIFNYGNRLMKLEDRNVFNLLNDDDKFKIYCKLQNELTKTLKLEISKCNDKNVIYLLLFQHMLIICHP